MNPTDVRALEAEFAVRLPARYVAFMSAFPSELVETVTELGWCREPISERYFLANVDRIAELNRLVRLPDTPWLADDAPWPNAFFVIGDDMCGNYFALDTASGEAVVYFYDHDEAGFEVHSADLQEFAANLIAETQEFNRDQEGL